MAKIKSTSWSQCSYYNLKSDDVSCVWVGGGWWETAVVEARSGDTNTQHACIQMHSGHEARQEPRFQLSSTLTFFYFPLSSICQRFVVVPVAVGAVAVDVGPRTYHTYAHVGAAFALIKAQTDDGLTAFVR